MRILYARPQSAGWNPVTVMVHLMAEVTGAELIEVPAAAPLSRVRALTAYRPRRRAGDPLVLIAPEPVDLRALLLPEVQAHRATAVAAWVFDSWWDDRIPNVARTGRWFDRIYLTEVESISPWQQMTGAECTLLPWGSDALTLGWTGEQKEVDVLRVGRQPPALDDDSESARALARVGLRFAGRPPFGSEPAESHARLLAAMRSAKVLLASGTRANPEAYTHPTRDYLTGRWVDALAAGCVVAGSPPQCATAGTVLPPSALLEVGVDDLSAVGDAIADYLSSWTIERAAAHAAWALESLDWRWRFATIIADLGVSSPALTAGLAELGERAATLRDRFGVAP